MNGRVPRYHRIAESLRGRIRGGEWPAGAPLPNQRRLARDFGVTLMTLRQALELLERDHLITRRHGLGTFVAAPTIDYEILKLRRFAGELSAQGESVTTRVLDARPAVADRRASAALGLPLRARVVVVERLRLVDDHPMSLQRSFLPARIGEEVLTADLAETPLSQVLEFKLGIVVARAHEAVSAVRLGRGRRASWPAPPARPPSSRSVCPSTPAAAPSCSIASSSRAIGSGSPVNFTTTPRRPSRRTSEEPPRHEDPGHGQAGSRHRHPGEDRGRRQADRHRRHHVDRLALRRVRRGRGAAHQGEAGAGRGRRRLAGARPGQGGAALGAGHGLRPRHPRQRSGPGRRRHADDGAGAGRGHQAGGAAARAVRAPGHRRRHGRGRRPAGRDPGLAVRVLDHGGDGRRRRQDRAGGAPGRGRAGGVRPAAARRALRPEGHERAALPDAEGDHGRQEEGDQGREGRRSRPGLRHAGAEHHRARGAARAAARARHPGRPRTP